MEGEGWSRKWEWADYLSKLRLRWVCHISLERAPRGDFENAFSAYDIESKVSAWIQGCRDYCLISVIWRLVARSWQERDRSVKEDQMWHQDCNVPNHEQSFKDTKASVTSTDPEDLAERHWGRIFGELPKISETSSDVQQRLPGTFCNTDEFTHAWSEIISRKHRDRIKKAGLRTQSSSKPILQRKYREVRWEYAVQELKEPYSSGTMSSLQIRAAPIRLFQPVFSFIIIIIFNLATHKR